MNPQQNVPEHLRDITSELVDDDFCIMAIRREGVTRGQAKAILARERDLDFREVRVRKTAYRRNVELEREYREEGIREPYDGWPLIECGPGEDGVEFWACEL